MAMKDGVDCFENSGMVAEDACFGSVRHLY